jgi:oxalate decarboxylase/phosphoglucose isomerase-like protein (cupin superfamily)
MDHVAGNVIEISLNVKHYIINIIEKTLVFVEALLNPTLERMITTENRQSKNSTLHYENSINYRNYWTRWGIFSRVAVRKRIHGTWYQTQSVLV